MIERFLNNLPANLPEYPVILDVGSYTGEQAIEFASQFPKARIFAFEANPASATIVRQNVAKCPQIRVVEAAVHEFDGDVTFQVVDEGNPGASSLFLGSGVREVQIIQQRPQVVRAIRLDTWARQAAITRIDLVWMDLQGAELLALQSMGELHDLVIALQLEITYRELYHGQVMWPEARQFLESHGMQLVDEWPDICGYFGDAVFVRAGLL